MFSRAICSDHSSSSGLQLSNEDQQVLRQWLTKADAIVTFILHCAYRSEILTPPPPPRPPPPRTWKAVLLFIIVTPDALSKGGNAPHGQ